MKKEKKKIIIIIAIVLVVLVLLALLYFLVINKKEEVTVTIITDSEDKIIVVNETKKVKLPEPDKKEGYTFLYYELDGEVFDENTYINESVELNAIYVPNNSKTITVNYNLDGGTGLNEIKYEEKSKIVLPMTPRKEGYVFVEWQDIKGNVIHNNDIISSNNMSLKAIWKPSTTKSSNNEYTCDTFNGECTVKDNKCNCVVTKNAVVKSYSCSEGSYYLDYNECSLREDTKPTCDKGTYDESKGGCVVTTKMVKGCEKGMLRNGTCYDETPMKGFDPNLLGCAGYMPANSNKCYGYIGEATKVCPKGYKKESSSSCYKIVEPLYCKEGYTLIEVSDKKLCMKKTESSPEYSCQIGYTLDKTNCVKTNTYDALKKISK